MSGSMVVMRSGLDSLKCFCLGLMGLGTGMVSSVCGGIRALVSWLSAAYWGMSGTSGISGAVVAGCGLAGLGDRKDGGTGGRDKGVQAGNSSCLFLLVILPEPPTLTK